MLTDDMKKWIDLLLPAADARSELLRRAVRFMAARDGVMLLSALAFCLEREEHPLYVALTPWDGIRWEGIEGHITARLAPWVRQAIGLPVTSEELLADLGSANQDDDEPTAYHRQSTRNTAGFVRTENFHVASPEELEAMNARRREAKADRLADIRVAVAGARNVATVPEALEHAHGERYVTTGREI